METLAHLLYDRELAGRLERAVENETRLLAIDDDEVDAILSVLGDRPPGSRSSAASFCANDGRSALTPAERRTVLRGLSESGRGHTFRMPTDTTLPPSPIPVPDPLPPPDPKPPTEPDPVPPDTI